MHTCSSAGAVVGLAAMLSLCHASAQAALLSYEGFAYTRGDSLHAKAGGTGWSIPWSAANGNQSIFGPGLTHPQASSATGNAVAMGSVAALRYFGSDINPGTTGFWASFLVNRLEAGSGGAIQFVGPTDSETTLGVALGFGAATSPVFLAESTAGNIGASNASSPAVTAGVTSLVVVRVTPLGTAYRADLFIDPTVQSMELGASLTLQNTTPFRGVVLTGVPSGGTVFDEVRIGDTLEDVTNLPSPGTGLGLSAASVLMARRRRA